jgi:hypothetical protein
VSPRRQDVLYVFKGGSFARPRGRRARSMPALPTSPAVHNLSADVYRWLSPGRSTVDDRERIGT